MKWSLSHTQSILENKGNKSWTSRWLEVLKVEQEKGFHPEFPKFGFGDPTSVSIIADCVSVVAPCGAVRHGAECFNFFFPQELDDEYLVIWQGFPDIPWKSHTEPELRKFLLDRLEEGFNFPMNPVWPVRDQGWYDVFTKQRSSEQGKKIMTSWIPSEMAAKIEEMYASNPDGFVKQGVARRGSVLTGALDLEDRGDVRVESRRLRQAGRSSTGFRAHWRARSRGLRESRTGGSGARQGAAYAGKREEVEDHGKVEDLLECAGQTGGGSAHERRSRQKVKALWSG